MDFMEALKAQKEEFELSEQDKVKDAIKRREELSSFIDSDPETSKEPVMQEPVAALDASFIEKRESSSMSGLSDEYQSKIEELLLHDQNSSFSDLFYVRIGMDPETRKKQSQKEAASFFMQYMGWM